MRTVLDASALLAYVKGEPDTDIVRATLHEAAISTVNWSEVVQKALALEADVDGMLEEFEELGLKIEPFTADDAERTARLWVKTKEYGLSLGDRACLSLGSRLDATVLTSDRTWKLIELAVNVQLIR